MWRSARRGLPWPPTDALGKRRTGSAVGERRLELLGMKAHRFSCMSVPPGKGPFNDDFEAANCATVSEIHKKLEYKQRKWPRFSRPLHACIAQFIDQQISWIRTVHCVPPLRRLEVRSQTSGPRRLLRERCDVTRSLTSGNSKTQTLPKITYSFELLLAMSSNLLAMASDLVAMASNLLL